MQLQLVEFSQSNSKEIASIQKTQKEDDQNYANCVSEELRNKILSKNESNR